MKRMFYAISSGVLFLAILLMLPEHTKLQGSACSGCSGFQYVCAYCMPGGYPCRGGLQGCTGPCGTCIEVDTNVNCAYNQYQNCYCPLPPSQWVITNNGCH